MDQRHHHQRRRRARRSCGAILLFLLTISHDPYSIPRAEALPRNNNNGKSQDSSSLNSLASRRGGGTGDNRDGGGANRRQGGRHPLFDGSRTSSTASSTVALHDSFPCESDQQLQGQRPSSSDSSPSTKKSTTASAPASNINYLNTNSFAAQNNLQAEPSSQKPTSTVNTQSSLNTRGGAIIMDSISKGGELDDDELDQMVDDLIAGLEDENDDENDAESVDVEDESEVDDDEADDEETEEQEEDEDVGEEDPATSEEEGEEEAVSDEEIGNTKMEYPPSETSAKEDSASKESIAQSSSHRHHPPGRSSRPSLSTIPTTPTNAYYRFLVRRGPKGHILASFTLVSVQWVYTYFPYIYQSIATVLLKLHIYNPKVLYERERQRQMEMRYGPRKKKGLTSKLFGTSKSKSNQALQQKAMQKQADEEAATKLKQLYKTMKIGSGVSMLSEVKYRYLSVGFRKRHGLGKEYRMEKPRTFMGEVVEGSFGEDVGESLMGSDDIVFSDTEPEVEDEMQEEGALSQIATAAAGQLKKQQKGRQQQRLVVKRKKINDWVVKAFITSHQPRKPTSASTAKEVTSSLWSEVERDAILAAAWESRAAEQLATAAAGKGRRRGDSKSKGRGPSKSGEDHLDDDGSDKIETASTSGSSGYGASKMFQSVMKQVGSNGRIFGAYPNDAPPIEECAHERGVIQLARRYGYGQWRANDDIVEHGEEEDMMRSDDEEGGDGSWGGGDLMFDDNEAEVDMPSLSPKRSKSQKKKKTRTIPVSSMNYVEMATAVKTRRRKRSSKSKKGDVLLGLSGGGTSGSSKSHLTFEVGIDVSATKSRQRVDQQRPTYSKNVTPLSPTKSSRQRDITQIKSQLQDERSSSVLFASDTRIKAPLQLLNEIKAEENNDQ